MDSLYQINEKLIFDSIVNFKKFYVDIEFLKYIDLGRLLIHQDLTPTQYDRILSVIVSNEFRDRHTNDTSILFQSVPDIHTLLNTSHSIDNNLLLIISPTFKESLHLINRFLIQSETAQRLTRSTEKATMVVDVSILPGLASNVTDQLKQEYAQLLNVNVEILQSPLSTLQTQVLDYDAFFISDLNRFNLQMLDHLNAERCIEKYLICSRILPLSQLPDITEDNIDITFTNIELVMTAATKFHYIRPFTCLT